MRTTWFQIRIFTLVLISSALLSGCGMFGDKEEDVPPYFKATESSPLRVPDDLNKPRSDQKLVIEGENVPAAGEVTATNIPPRVQHIVQDESSSSALKYGSRGTYLLIADTSDSVFRRLKFAIERSGFQLLGTNADERSYDLYYTEPPKPIPEKSFFKKMLFWQKVEVKNYSGTYRANLEADGDSTRIYLEDVNGRVANESVADAVLNQFLQRLG